MNNYVIFTDSGCDLSEELLKEWGIRYAALTYSFNDSPKQYGNYEIPSKEFYQKMREGGIAKTAASTARPKTSATRTPFVVQ